MIKSKYELNYYIIADLLMNRGIEKLSIKQQIIMLINKDYIMLYLSSMRKYDYYSNQSAFTAKIGKYISHFRMKQLGLRLGFSIEPNVFGYGLVIPHYGTVVVGGGNKIGNYAVLHTSTCITSGSKQIGDGLYLSSGAKVVHDIKIGENVTIGVNSVVNKNCLESNCLLAGMPATVIKETAPWYIRDGEEYLRRYSRCEELRKVVE